MPLLMIAQRLEGFRIRDPAASAHIGERGRKLLLGRWVDVGTRRGADDERRNGGIPRVVEDVGEVEAATCEGNGFDEGVGHQGGDEAAGIYVKQDTTRD